MQEDAPETLEQVTEEEDLQVLAAPDWLCCRVCETRIVLASAGISFDGSQTHRFSNPMGLEFDIALYDDAPGCRGDGDATEYYSWFPGYAWRIAVCSGCWAHLGWSFHCIGPPGVGEPGGFHGLIVDRLRPEAAGGAAGSSGG